MASELVVGVLTVSDSCHAGSKEDSSGPALQDAVQQAFPGCKVVRALVPDEVEDIQEAVRRWTASCALVLTTGGTGFGPRDVTPEAVRPLLDREAPGLVVRIVTQSLAVTPLAMLSRPVAGVCGATLVVTFPGSRKAATECFGFVQPALPHALDLLSSQDESVARVHADLQSGGTGLPAPAHQCPHHAPAASSHGHKHGHGHGHGGAAAPGVALRARQSTFAMTPMDEATAMVLGQSLPLGTERVALAAAYGRILAEDVFAVDPLPPFPASVKDGYAVIAADGACELTVLGPSNAGHGSAREVTPGTTVRISTGAPIPKGADAVVMVEYTELVEEQDGEEVTIRVALAAEAGQDIRAVGSDIGQGDQVLACGDWIGAPEIGLLASIGALEVLVRRKPVVALLSTGDEVREPTATDLTYGQIRDSNRAMLAAAVISLGFEVLDLGIAADEPGKLEALLQRGIAEADVLLTSGGVSMGEKDLLKPTLLGFGGTIHFGRVRMKPGKPTTFATVPKASVGGETPRPSLIFALPGNPVSCLVTFYLFALPALRKLSGYQTPELPILRARTRAQIQLDARPEYHRVVLRWAEAGQDLPVAVSTGSQCSSRLLSTKSANGLMILPPRTDDCASLAAGAVVDVMLLSTHNQHTE